MSYEGKSVRHFIYGEGTIVQDNGNKVFVEFPDNEKYADNRYCFDVPEAFKKGHLELLNGVEIDAKPNKTEQIDPQNNNKYRDLYKKAFWDYLNEEKIRRTGSPYKQDTPAVDSFYLEKHSTKRDFLEWMKSDETMEEAKEELKLILGDPNDAAVRQRAQGYFTPLCKLREFLKQRGVV